MGLNSFFQGSSASDIQVASNIVEDSGRFASGKTPDRGDTRNLFALTDLETSHELPGNTTLTQFVNEINTEIGFQISADVALGESLSSLQIRLEQDQASYSGVDLNEEIVQLQKFQRSYEAAAQVLQVADDMLTTLFSILR